MMPTFLLDSGCARIHSIEAWKSPRNCSSETPPNSLFKAYQKCRILSADTEQVNGSTIRNFGFSFVELAVE